MWNCGKKVSFVECIPSLLTGWPVPTLIGFSVSFCLFDVSMSIHPLFSMDN